jgi:heat shock protein HslJ
MPKILIAFLLGLFVIGCNSSDTSSAADAPAEEATADAGDSFHPTDALLIGGNGGFNPSGSDGGADLGDVN